MSSTRRLLGSLPTNILLVVLALGVSLLPLILSEPLVRRMADEERLKMQTWAEATECIASQSDEQLNALALQILESNTTIPLILTDSLGNILGYKNIDPEEVARDSTVLEKRLTAFRSGYAPIEIDLGTAGRQYLYYSDSSNLRRLLRFPYLQTGIFILYIIILVLNIRSLLHWEHDRIWVGLSKETAHQLGTPISSLMAWTEPVSYTHLDVYKRQGYTPWSLWSGLNDATRNQENTTGLQAADYGLGGIGGTTNIKMCIRDRPATAGNWAVGTTTFKVGSSDLTVYVTQDAAGFAGKQYAASKTGDLTGYVSLYKGAVQLCPRNMTDACLLYTSHRSKATTTRST